MTEQVYGPIITGCVTLLLGWLLISGFRRGEMKWPFIDPTSDDNS
jgi:hypothetical protein